MFKKLTQPPPNLALLFAKKPTTPNPIRKVLIANRGEIACRIMRTAKKLNMETVSIFSEVDKDSMHVHLADESFSIGESPQSYLNIERIILTAKAAGVDAVHPGYGFLSENSYFARRCRDEHITFVGPTPKVMDLTASKSECKRFTDSLGIPSVPGYQGEDQSIECLTTHAHMVGYPLIIKPVFGGGGKGMKIVEHPQDFKDALLSAQREAELSFGNTNVLLERYIEKAKHVEVQILGDMYGNCATLFERDCSIQRRHQKIIEEAPAPRLSHNLRQKMLYTAEQIGRQLGYQNAGTVEFIIDLQTNKHYFMEINPRIQVEHPVTEMLTGVDLVALQFAVAEKRQLGDILSFPITKRGHAFEVRICAEQPNNGFVPSVGLIKKIVLPKAEIFTSNVRLDMGYQAGQYISHHYDSLVGKLIVGGKDRSDALVNLKRVLSSIKIEGIETNLNYVTKLLYHPKFVRGELSTRFIEEHAKELESM